MSSSRSPVSTPVSGLSPYAENLTPKAKTWMKMDMLFRFNPREPVRDQNIPPGMYFFVQANCFPHVIYLYRMCQYGSRHPELTKWVGLDDDKLLSAGEIIVGAADTVIGWSFRTGYYFDRLKLVVQGSNEEFLQQIGLPRDSYYSAQDWIDFADYFKEFFHGNGKYQSILILPGLALSTAASDVSMVEAQKKRRVERSDHEAAMLKSLSDVHQKLYAIIKSNRDAVEQMPERKVVMEKRRNASAENLALKIAVPAAVRALSSTAAKTSPEVASNSSPVTVSTITVMPRQSRLQAWAAKKIPPVDTSSPAFVSASTKRRTVDLPPAVIAPTRNRHKAERAIASSSEVAAEMKFPLPGAVVVAGHSRGKTLFAKPAKLAVAVTSKSVDEGTQCCFSFRRLFGSRP